MKHFTSIAMLILTTASLFSQPVKEWEHVYADSSSSMINDLVVDAQGNSYLLLQGQQTDSTGAFVAYLPVIMKLDAAGNVLWSTTYTRNGANDAYLHSITVDEQGELYAAGWYITLVPLGHSWTYYYIALLAKFNSNGTLEWEHTLDQPQVLESHAYKMIFDGDYIYASGYSIDSAYYGSHVLVKLDMEGNEVWRRYTVCAGFGEDYPLLVTGSNHLLTGCVDSLQIVDTSGSTVWASDTTIYYYNNANIILDAQDNFYLLSWVNGWAYSLTRHNADGSIAWTIDSLNSAMGYGDWSLHLTTDDEGNVYAGSINQGWTNDSAHVYKISPQGDVLWATLVDQDPVGIVYSNGKLLTAGSSYANNYYERGISRLDATTGAIDWTIIEGDSLNPLIAELLRLDNAGNLFVASRVGTNSQLGNFDDVAVAKYSNVVSVNENPKDEISFNLYPNPTGELLYVTMETRQPVKPLMLSIYNILGTKVHEQTSSRKLTVINTSDLSPGVYIVKAEGAAKRFVKN